MFYVRHHESVKCQLLADIFLVVLLGPCHLCLSGCYARGRITYHFKTYCRILCLAARFCIHAFDYTVVLVFQMMHRSDDICAMTSHSVLNGTRFV